MLRLILGVLILASGSRCERNYPLVPSISDVARMGATALSIFLNSNSPQVLSSAFSKLTDETKMSHRNDEGQRNQLILLALKMIGVDNEKIAHFAFDGFISLIYLMNQILIKNRREKEKERRRFSLFRFVISRTQVDPLLTQMQDPKLLDLVLKESEEKLRYYPDENVDCIKVLICRIKPFVEEMQRSLRFFMNRENIKVLGKETCEGKEHEEETCRKREEEASWDKATLEDRMYFFTPSLKKVIEFAEKCDQLFPNCVY